MMRSVLSTTVAALLISTTLHAATREQIEQKFKELDKNADGSLSAEEVAAPKMFKILDRDGDGKVTLEEAVAATPEIEAEMRKAAAGGKGAPAVARSGTEGKFHDLDKNHDGVLTPDELTLPRLFKMLDRDGDGKVTLEEAIAMTPAAEAAARVEANGGQPIVAPPGPRAVPAAEVAIGLRVDDLVFHTTDGKDVTLTEATGANGTVIAFTSTTCPVSKRYLPALLRLESTLREKGLALVMVDPFTSDKAEDLRAATTAAGFQGVVAQDRENTIVRGLQARTTTEVFLIDATRTLLYRGALDDQYGLNYNLDAPKQTFLLDAVAALLTGHKVVLPATTAPGCDLDTPAPVEKAITALTFHGDIQRILQQNCAECHHAGGVGPFSVEDRSEVLDHAKTIKRVVEQGIMPPWFALPAEAGHSSPWSNDRTLSPESKRELVAWLDSKDRPAGNPADAPKPIKWPEGWTYGEPDAVFTFAKPIDIKAEGLMPYINVEVPTNFPEDRWVSAVEVLPGARQNVHHVVVTTSVKGEKMGRDQAGEGFGYFALYVPGTSVERSPAGMAKKLKAGATLRCQMHYTPNGTATSDVTKIGLFFTKEEPTWEIRTAAAMNNKIAIPANDPNHMESARVDLPPNVLVLSLFPHMHVRGKAFKYDLVQPDGTSGPLLEVPRYDFNWQLTYNLAQPFLTAPGTYLKITAWYDNSAANKANPDPNKNVRWGLMTNEEMLVGSVRYAVPIKKPADTAQR